LASAFLKSGYRSRIYCTITRKEPLCALLAGNDPKPIVLDLVQPLAFGGQLISLAWEARRDESSREGTLQHVGQITFGQSRLQLHH